MPTASDLAQQKRLADEQKRKTNQLISKEKNLLREQIAELDREIAALHAQRSRAAADLSKFG